jgi:leucyl-tRNA synthetase
MQEIYDFVAVETAAQKFWNETRAFEVTEDGSKPKFFCMSMLPYPSGALHMGHVRNYTIGDVHHAFPAHERQERAAADGLGRLSAAGRERRDQEQHAPAKVDLREHRAHARAAQDDGLTRSTGRASSRPAARVLRARAAHVRAPVQEGLVYRKNSVVNFDPVDQTVLANEQVVDGRGWRSGAIVEKREIPNGSSRSPRTRRNSRRSGQAAGLAGLGQDDAAQLDRALRGTGNPLRLDGQDGALSVFTTRPDTLMGATFCRSPRASAGAAGGAE